jgi:uncharacterized protein
MKTMTRSLSLLLILTVISCVTINIYFPAEEIRGAADKIVNEVWGNGANDGTDGVTPQLQENPGSSLLYLFLPSSAYAAQDINVSTPVIRSIKASIKDRSGTIIEFLNNGAVGLSHNGLLKIRSSKKLSLKQKGQLNKLVKAENNDRKRLYQEIAVANKFPEKVADVQNIFADSWRKQAKNGWYLEKSDGIWQKK